MKATSAAHTILLFLSSMKAILSIKSRLKTGLGKGTISRISKEVDGNKENNLGGHPSKLSARDKQSIVCQIKSGKLENAVEATQFINALSPTLSHPKQSEMH